MLQDFGDRIWIANGPNVSVAGFDYPTRMVVIRLADGSLFVWSPIALSQDLRLAVDALGAVGHVVAPNTLHHKFVGEWQRTYPTAKCYAVPQLRSKRPDIRWDADLDDAPPDAWSSDINQAVVRGNRITTEVVFFHRRSGTAIFADLLQNFEPGWFRGWRAIVAKLDLLTTAQPTVPRKFRIAFSDRKIAKRAIGEILSWPTQSVLAAHATPVRENGHAVIEHAFAWLMRD